MLKHLGTFAVLAVCLFAIVIVMGGCDGERIQQLVQPSVENPGTVPPVEVTQQRFTGTLPVPDNDPYTGGLAWNPQGTMLAAGFRSESDEIWLYDTATGEYLKNLKGDFGNGVQDGNLAWGRALFIGTDHNDVQMWDPATGQHLKTIIGEQAYDMAISPDSRILAANGEDEIRLIDIGTGQVLQTITEEAIRDGQTHYWVYTDVAFSPDGSTIAASAWLRHPVTSNVVASALHLYDVATGRKKVEGVRYIGEPSFRSVAWQSDGSMLACLFRDGGISWVDAVTGQPFGPEEYPNDFPDDVSCIAWHPTTPSILALGRWNGVIELWDLDFATWQILKTLTHGDDVGHLAFSPDGKTLASSNGTTGDTIIRLWDVSDVR